MSSLTSNAELSYMHVQRSWGGDIDYLRVYYRTSSSGSWTLITGQSYTSAVASWTAREAITLPNSAGCSAYQIAFEMEDNYGYGVGIDYVRITPPPTCPKTGIPTASSITTDAATISWTPVGTESTWNLRYKKANAASWTEVKGLTSASHNLTGLSSGTTYNYEVQADCGGGDKSDWNAGTDFPTECATATLPFEPVITAGSKPNCWTIADASWGDAYSGRWYTYVYSSKNCLRYLGAKGSLEAFVQTPSIVLSGKATLKFKYANYNSGRRCPAKVYISDGTTTKTVTLTNTDNATLVDAEIDLSNVSGTNFTGKTITIKFSGSGHSSSSGTGYVWIADIKIEAEQDCSAPQNVALSGSSISTADFAWDANAGVDSYKYCVVAQGEAADWSGDLTANTNSAHIDGLTVGNYTFYVKCACGTAATSLDFEIVSCPSVSSVTLSNPLYNGITVNWATSASTNCDVRYKEAGDADWTSAGTNISATTKTISGLIPGGTYSFEVKSSCGETWVAAGETYAPEWPIPGTPAISDYSDVSVTATWTAATDADGYEYVVMPGTTAADWTSPTAVNALTTSLTGLAGATNYTVYLRAKYGSARSAEVSANFTTVCVAPTNLVKGEVTYTTAQFSWSQGSADDQYQYVLSNGTEAPTWQNGTTLEAGVRTVTVPVESGNNYTFYVRSVYNGSSYSSAVSENFNTPCPPKASLPYTCGFESTDEDPFASNGSYNPCWKRIGSPVASSTYKHSGSRSLCFTGTSEQYAILPEFENAVKGMQISFWHRNYFPTSYASTLTLGTMTDPTDASTFTAIKSMSQTNVFVEVVEESLAGAGASDHYIAFKYTGSSSLSAAYLDDITVEVLPSCLKPSGVAASNETGTTADLSWTSTASAWKIQYSTTSDFSSDVHEVNANTNPFTLTGLTPNHTTYYARVKADCGGGDLSDWSNVSDPFQTECADITVDADHEWTENFNNQTVNQLPACWSAAGNTTAVYVVSSSSYLTLSSKALYFSGGSGTEAIAILPDVTTDVNTLQIAFSHVEESTSSSGKVRFGYYKDAAFTALKTCDYSTSSSAWKDEAAFAIAGVPSGAKLAFAYKPNSSGWTAAIDNITISLAASCAVPSDVVGEGLSTTTASISWTAGGEETAWKLQYSTDGENWTDANEGNNITDNPYELTDLSAGTTYYARVKADCGSDLSDWSAASAGFKTDCNAVELADFATETFATSSVPDCWKVTTVGDKSWATTTSNYQRHSSPYAMQFAAYTEVGNYSDLISPAITLTEDAFLKFYLYNSYSSDPVVGEVYIQYESTTTKIYDFVVTNNVEQQVVDLAAYTGKTAKFIFRGHGNGQSNYRYAAIDDVEVVAKPCDAPTELSKVESSSSVVLSWTDDAASKWNLRWREVTEPESAWNNVENLVAKNLTLAVADGLAFEKTYQAQVQAVCSDVKSSAWGDLISFGLICGSAPTNLTVSARSTNSATLTWEGAESAFQLETSLDGDTWESPIAVNAKTYGLTELTAGQTYYVRVQNACGGDFTTTSFKTWCGLQDAAELPLNVTSFSNPLPACWEVTFKGEWSGISGSKICFYGTEEQWVVLPAYDIDLNKLSVTFTFTTSSATATFGYLDAPNGEFHAFASQPTSGVELDLAAEASAPKYIAVRYNGGSSDYNSVTISSISIRKTPGCFKPTGVAGTPGVGSASINWTNGGSEEAWNIQYKLASVASWDGAAQVAASTKPFELTGLEQGVTYKVRVQAACAGEDPSDWSDEAEFTTDCDVIAALPFIETFDAALSNCWDITDEETTWYAHSVFGGELRLPGGKTASGHLVKLPNITAYLTNAAMTIEYKATTGANTAVPQVGYIDGEGEFQELAALAKSNTTTEARVALATANGKRLALRYDDGTSEGNFDIAEIRILEQVTLADNEDNAGKLSANLNKVVDVTLGRTIFCDGDYNTICLPFDLSEEQLAESPLAGATFKAFKYAMIEPEELQVRVIDVEGGLQAGVPYLLKMTADENLVSPLFTNVTISATAGKTVGQDQAVKFIGTFAPVAFEKGNQSTLFVHTNNNLTWSGKDNTSLKAFRAYFQRTSAPTSAPLKPGMRARIVEHNEATTGINNTNVENVTLKFIENDQVVIIRNGVKYNIQGQVISK